MSLIVGIDFDSNQIDFVTLDEEKNDATWRKVRIDGGPGGAFQRARRVRDLMPARTAWRDAGVLSIAVEKPMSNSFGTAAVLMRVQGAILAALPRDLDVEELPPELWKATCGLPGNARKDAVASWAQRMWTNRPPGTDQNALDAYAIAWAWRHLQEHHSAPRRAA